MLIGIPKETKIGEGRVALIPEHVSLLSSEGHLVCVERDAGKKAGFTNTQYKKAGAVISEDVYDCDMIVRVKEPSIATIRDRQIIMGYLHIEKGQNMTLLKSLLDKRVTSYAFEEIRDSSGSRKVNLGVEAGIVGMYEGLRLYGKIMKNQGKKSQFAGLKPIRRYPSAKAIYRALEQANLHNGVKVYILGKGRVSHGAQKVLAYSKIDANVLYRKETSNIEKYLGGADIIVNAVDWYPDEPRIITKNMLRLMKGSSLIVDISCDENGAIESCIPTSWRKPYYTFNGVTHYCVDNLPTAIPKDSSVHLSTMIIDHVLRVANGEELDSGLMTKEGIFEFAKRQGVLEKFEEELLVVEESI